MRCIILPSLLLLMAAPACLANAGMPLPVSDFLEKNCRKCHDTEVQKGGLNLTALLLEVAEPETVARWVQVFDRVQAGEIPPKRQPRPDSETERAFLASLGDELQRADLQRIAAEGRVKARRLTRI